MNKLLLSKDFKFYKLLASVLLGFFVAFAFSNFASSAQNNILKVIKSGNGSGVVKLESPGMSDIICKFNKNSDSSCGGRYPKDADVTITATPDSGSSFGGWGGACSGGNSACAISKINNDKEIKVFFDIGGNNNNSSSVSNSGGPYNLTLEKGSSNGTGMVELTVLETGKTVEGFKTCYMKASGSSCSYNYPAGSSVKLKIVPDSGMGFSLSGDCSGSATNCDFTMNGDKKVVADFVPSGDLPPKINFFYADPSAVKTGASSILHGQAANVSRCTLTSRDDSSVGTYSCPTIFSEWCSTWASQGVEPYYWRDVAENFTWDTSLGKEGTYNYTLFCRGKGSYDNQFFGNGIIRSDLAVEVMNNVTLNVTKSGGGAGTVTSNTFAPSFAWSNNGLVPGEPRRTGYCSAGNTYVATHSCNSLTVGSKVYDGSDRGTSYGDWADAFPIYDGLKTATAREYTNSCSLGLRSGGTVNEWQCKDKVFDIDCGSMCSASYVFGDNKKVILTATPNFGSIFSKWTGATCEEGKNNGNTCTVTMDKLRIINAEFSSVGIIPVASWHFEETSGSGAYIKDATVYGNNLSPTGTILTGGVSGNARNLNSKNEYLMLYSPINIPVGSSARTIEFWAKPSNLLTTDTGYVFGYGVGGVNQAFGVSVSGGNWVFQGFGGADMNSGVAATPEKWTYVAVTYDGSILKIYINGVLVNSDSRGLNTPSSAFYIGRAPWDSASNFVGAIDEFRVSVGVLSASEISNRYSLYAK